MKHDVSLLAAIDLREISKALPTFGLDPDWKGLLALLGTPISALLLVKVPTSLLA